MTTTLAPSTTITTAPKPTTTPIGTYAVGVRDDTYVDASRPTPANGDAPGGPARVMPTTVWYPASGPPGAPPALNAPANIPDGPYPLVLFAHGFAVRPRTYEAMLGRWASAGYVVVAPAIPLLNGDAPGGASHLDFGSPNVADFDFALGEALRRAGTAGDPLSGLVDPAKVAVTGHSDGEELAYLLAFGATTRDPRVRAVVPMAGDLNDVDARPVASGVPVLHVMAERDEYDPYPGAISFDREQLPAPKYLLTMRAGLHLPPFTDPVNPHFDVVVRAVVDFLDGTLKDPAGLQRLRADTGAAPNLVSLEVAT